MKHSTSIKSYLYTASGIAILILSWLIISEIIQNDLIFPTCSDIVMAILRIFSKTQSIKILIFDILRIVASVIGSFGVSLIVVFFYICFRGSYYIVKPILTFFKTIPVVALSIFIWLAVGGKFVPIITTSLVIVPVMIQGLVGAIDEMDSNLVDELKMVNNNQFIAFFKVYLPYLFPYIIIVFFQTFGLGLKVMITSEYLCQTNNSIGKSLYIAQTSIQIDTLLGWSIIIVFLVGIVEMLIRYFSKKIIN